MSRIDILLAESAMYNIYVPSATGHKQLYANYCEVYGVAYCSHQVVRMSFLGSNFSEGDEQRLTLKTLWKNKECNVAATWRCDS